MGGGGRCHLPFSPPDPKIQILAPFLKFKSNCATLQLFQGLPAALEVKIKVVVGCPVFSAPADVGAAGSHYRLGGPSFLLARATVTCTPSPRSLLPTVPESSTAGAARVLSTCSLSSPPSLPSAALGMAGVQVGAQTPLQNRGCRSVTTQVSSVQQ